MKNNIKLIVRNFLIILLMTFALNGLTQGPPPPPGGADGGGSGTGGADNSRTGGGAPIGGGLFILLGLATAYGGRKLYQMRKENLEE